MIHGPEHFPTDKVANGEARKYCTEVIDLSAGEEGDIPVSLIARLHNIPLTLIILPLILPAVL